MNVRPVAATAATILGVGALVLPGTAGAAGHAGRSAQDGAPTVVAHRGASAYAPENTLAAVDAAARLGIRWVENDVQRTKDGELVVMHDPTLERTTNVEQVFPDRAPWKVADFTAAEIARLDAGSWFGEEYAGQRVPTLRQYLHRVSVRRQSLLLEIKRPELYPGIESQILRVLDRQGWLDAAHRNRLTVQSFSADSVRAVHGLRSSLKTGFLGTPPVADLPEYARFADQINPSHSTISAGYVAEVHRLEGAHGKPLEVFTWTVNDASTAVRVQGYGVDGIISNTPDVVREATGGGYWKWPLGLSAASAVR
ncbi:glycerophosphodiester phosphodiesterase family protein [Streptomyces sp. GC420]|uniref:glycerophosphodiester phosphodiesterase n=1 Tax=Streptomyces sp. GC420 TaxID=2697568 RepID=UPI001414CE62|nr:glycerophosphodiester phosphodiesterase family protein [Streptomyces sp. GC420]NBM18282.1 glycerophosphodiester phosphodiesterase [Streptomyces sp. GC420]